MNRTWFHSLLMFVWLIVGYAAVHIVLSVWGISVLQAIWPSSVPVEALHITNDGEPIIQSYTNSYYNATFRRLDGTLISDRIGLNRMFAGSTYLTVPEHAEPGSWSDRISSFHDFQKPATCWYSMIPPNRASTAYFVGYDKLSRRKIGYLGINGFSLQQPSVEQSFPVSTSQYAHLQGVLVATQKVNNYSEPFEPDGDSIESQMAIIPNAATDAVWILSNSTIYEIRLGSRTVRTVIDNRPDLRFLERRVDVEDEKVTMKLLVRTETGLLTIDPDSGKSEFLTLESPPPHFYESIAHLKNGQNVVVHREISNRRGRLQQVNILWMDAQGQIERRAVTQLFGSSSDLWLDPDVACCLSLPIPIASVGALSISPWLIEPASTDMPKTFGGFSQFFAEFKMWLVISLLTGIVTGWACRRRERDVFGRSGWFWPILVGAFGWFGWMGYICLRPLPARLPHGCWMPARPEPNQPLGTEIFA